MNRLAACLFLLSVSSLGHAQIALRLEGSSSGTIFSSPGYTLGGVDLSEATPVYSYQWELSRDPADAGAVGPLIAGSFRVVVPFSQGMPLLTSSIVNAESMQGTFRFFGPNPASDVVELYQIQFVGARVLGLRPFATAENALNYSTELTISFTQASFTHVPTGLEAVVDAP